MNTLTEQPTPTQKTAMQITLQNIRERIEASNNADVKAALIDLENDIHNQGLIIEKQQHLETHYDGQTCNVHGEESMDIAEQYFFKTFNPK